MVCIDGGQVDSLGKMKQVQLDLRRTAANHVLSRSTLYTKPSKRDFVNYSLPAHFRSYFHLPSWFFPHRMLSLRWNSHNSRYPQSMR